MSYFKAIMHPNRFPLGLRPGLRRGSLQRSPDPLAGFKKPTFKAGEGGLGKRRKREEGRGRDRRDGKGRRGEGREGRGKGREGSPHFYDEVHASACRL